MILIAKLILISWLITQMDPIQEAFLKLFPWLEKHFKNKVARYIIDSLFIVSGCFKCMNFWFVLIGTGDIFAAIIAAIIGQAYSKIFIG